MTFSYPKLVISDTAAAIAVVTNAVEAACVLLFPAAAVGTFGVPVNTGDARFAFLPFSDFYKLF